ncbi:uncharacterized protein FIBRA_02644 [Fibroporia radiculosa]|uniref:Uncharacterized protein n=1 Tax=Fibroporia radiculosa TaxID=599839 RepID=J4G261_9APHY|nr:uncharacterized protein FIBRA_02644 [Fibroporia radiculosa]CCM00608.1 predicted protein [Fibroporia radiculosa]
MNDTGENDDEYQCCVGFLLEASSLGLHITITPDSAPTLSDALICTASYCIVTPALSSLPITDVRALEEMLATTRPKSETYDALVSPLFSPNSFPRSQTTPMSVTPTPPPDTMSPSPSPQGMQVLHVYAQTLRSRRLYHLEASLLSNALRHVDNILLTSNNLPFFKQPMPTGDMDTIRRELVQYIESAEARCFGARTGGIAQGLQAGVNANIGQGAAFGGASGNRWVWEDTMGCWAPESPVVQRREQRAPKRRRLSREHPTMRSVEEGRSLRSQSRSQESRRIARRSLPALNVARVVSGGRESMPSRRTSVSARNDDVAGSDDFEAQLGSPVLKPLLPRAPRPSKKLDRENVSPGDNTATHSRSLVQHSQAKLPMQRLTNFDTLLADAHKNCIVLHPEKLSDEAQNFRKHKLSSSPSRMRRQTAKQDLAPDNDFPSTYHLSSDDALDLFAYQSSPVVPKRMR